MFISNGPLKLIDFMVLTHTLHKIRRSHKIHRKNLDNGHTHNKHLEKEREREKRIYLLSHFDIV